MLSSNRSAALSPLAYGRAAVTQRGAERTVNVALNVTGPLITGNPEQPAAGTVVNGQPQSGHCGHGQHRHLVLCGRVCSNGLPWTAERQTVRLLSTPGQYSESGARVYFRAWYRAVEVLRGHGHRRVNNSYVNALTRATVINLTTPR
jgi:hypothetical protein